jgi:hypothetical protein
MHGCARRASEQHGDYLSGFALVTWDRSGQMESAYMAGHGPHGWASIPGQVRDALNRHMAVELAQHSTPIWLGDDEPMED